MAINYTKTNWQNGQAPAISATNLNKIEQGIKDCADECDGQFLSTAEATDLCGRLSIASVTRKLYTILNKLAPSDANHHIEQSKLLWSNASPNSSFSAQTVSITNLSSYDFLEVFYKVTASSAGSIRSTRLPVANSVSGVLFGQDGTVTSIGTIILGTQRAFTLNTTDNSIAFSGALDGTTATNNLHLIPYKIYGIKEV